MSQEEVEALKTRKIVQDRVYATCIPEENRETLKRVYRLGIRPQMLSSVDIVRYSGNYEAKLKAEKGYNS